MSIQIISVVLFVDQIYPLSDSRFQCIHVPQFAQKALAVKDFTRPVVFPPLRKQWLRKREGWLNINGREKLRSVK